MRRRKKGSSLIFVIIIFMFVLTVSAGILSMVSGNYKARAVESNRVENLYGAESGLDIAYNIIAKTVDNANIDSFKKVEQFKSDVEGISYNDYKDNYKEKGDYINKAKGYMYALKADIDYQNNIGHNDSKIKDDNEKIDLLINNVFQYYFKQYIDDDESLISNILYNVDNGKNIDINNSSKGKYKDLNDKDNELQLDYNGASIRFNTDSLEKTDDNDIKLKWDSSEDKEVILGNLVEEYHYVYDEKTKKDKLEINKADFDPDHYVYQEKITTTIDLISSFKVNSSVGDNNREIEVKYILTIPNYKDVVFENSIESGVNELPGITVAGSLNVNKSSLDVYGDIMVEGNNSSEIASIGNKYNNGITIHNEESTSDTPNIIKFHNNVFSRNTFNVSDNVYVDIGKSLYAKNIYVNSSNNNKGTYLGISGSDSKVILNNDLEMKAHNAAVDIRSFYGINDINLDNTGKGEQGQNSSSIIINNIDGQRNSFLTIEEEAYIRGVAHINIDGDKGYQTGESVAVKGNYNAYSVPLNPDNKFTFKSPLQLLDGSFQDKVNHFYDYWSNGSKENSATAKAGIDNGGVIFNSIDEVNSIGDIVYSDGSNTKVKKGSPIEDTEITTEKDDFGKNMYNLNVVNKTDKEYNKTNVNNTGDSIIGIVNKNAEEKIYKEKGLIFKQGDTIIDSSSDEKNFKGIYVVNGDLDINTECEIEGNLIVLGNLNINNGSKLTLKYNSELTKSIQNKNLRDINSIFIAYGKDIDLGNESQKIQSNSTRFIKDNIWKILK